MRRASLTIAALACAAAAHAGPLAIGDAVPETEVSVGQGRSMSVGALGDAGALVVFHSRSCVESREWESALIEIGNTATERLVRTTIVDPSGADHPGIRFGYVHDAEGAVTRAFGAATTPEAFLFDGGGHLVYHGALGTREGDRRNYLADALAAMLAKKPIAIAETAAPGCPIPSGE